MGCSGKIWQKKLGFKVVVILVLKMLTLNGS